MAVLQQFWGHYIVLFLLIITIDGTPNCIAKYETQYSHVICTPGHLDYSYILRRGLVSDNTETRMVTMQGCAIVDIDDNAFINMPFLAYLDLSHNSISKLKNGIFDGNSFAIRLLNFSYNSLTELSSIFFYKTPNLVILDLNSNQINLEVGIFDPLKELQVLVLSNNSLKGKDINPLIFHENKKVFSIYFTNNDMNGAPEELLDSFEVLEGLYLDKCQLHKVPSFATRVNLRTLGYLLLSGNVIRRLDDPRIFTNLNNVKLLNLANNVLEYINPSVFKPLTNLRSVILSGNMLSVLPKKLFQEMRHLEEVDLSLNRISTISSAAFRGTNVRSLNLANNRITYLSVNFCQNLRNAGPLLSKFHFDQNPWQCACLKAILDEVKHLNISYNSMAYDGKHPVCVTTDEFFCNRNPTFDSIYLDMYDSLNLEKQANTWSSSLKFYKDLEII